MKYLALLLALLTAPAFGQAPTCAYDSPESRNATRLLVPPVDPIQWFLTADDQTAFGVATWWCDDKYKWRRAGAVCWKGECKDKLIARGLAWLPQFVKDKAAIQSMWSAATCNKLPLSPAALAEPIPQECARWAPLAPFLVSQLEATKPPPIIWTVWKSASTMTSRPVFSVTATGARNTTAVSGQRVAVNVECACYTRAIEESGGVYCEVGGQQNVSTSDPADVLPADRVALCRRL